MKEEELRDLLQKLVQAIISTIDNNLRKGNLQPHYMQCIRWKVTKFEYTDAGVRNLGRQGDRFLKPLWNTNDVFQEIYKLSIYSDTEKAILEDYNLPENEIFLYLHQLIAMLATNILMRKVKTVTDTTKYIDLFLKDLNGEKQACNAKVQLKGLKLQPNSIQLGDNVRLSKPNRKDFETEETEYLRERLAQDPTAFLHVAVYAKGKDSSIALQNEIDKAITILRLFRVGAVQDMRRSETTASVIGFAASELMRGKLLGSADKYLVTRRDAKILKRFWANTKKVGLPDSAYSASQKESDALSIAYQRYTDSLDTHLFEKRISSAVMGLEALYLDEIDELPYRLSIRVGKLLSLTMDGSNPSEIRDNVKVAYKIRNKYVHGAILKAEDKRKLEEKLGDLNEFSKRIMDYLRASIVALLRRPNKKSLIQKIDDSFLDSNKDKEIKKLQFMPYKREVFHAQSQNSGNRRDGAV